ncbi:hypothetical protein FRC04_006048 [Tulasnella sp. 424]|nr:hypothetical protein FRC04_006048 [Tulasnella sp. 424]KAG8975640.1 hypothetical protein FRC05_005433 [Tulasnella sp. 425]
MAISSTAKPKTKASNSPLDRIPVETVIKIVRLSLLQVDYHPLIIMRRVEELRLVDTYWATCIDQCPTFWTHITSQANPARYTLWLEKSQNAPLHVDCRSDDKFIELLLPHTDRWQSLTFFSSSPNAWSHLTRPAPQLQELDLYGLPPRNYPAELFQGVIPRLNTVRLHGTLAPWHFNIFRGLRELVLGGYLGGPLHFPIELDGFLQALESSPSLEVLSVRGVVAPGNSSTSSNLDPVTLPSLRSFIFESPSYFLLGLIRIPNCTSTSIKCDSPGLSISEHPRDVWAAIVEILRLAAEVNISLYPTKLSIATRSGLAPHLKAKFTSIPFVRTMLIDLLREAELSQPLPTTVHLSLESPDEVPPILDFLAKPTEAGSKRLPKLQELHLKLHKVPVETVAGLILEHERLSVLWSRPLTIGEGWSRPEDITDRVLDAPQHQRWLR